MARGTAAPRRAGRPPRSHPSRPGARARPRARHGRRASACAALRPASRPTARPPRAAARAAPRCRRRRRFRPPRRRRDRRSRDTRDACSARRARGQYRRRRAGSRASGQNEVHGLGVTALRLPSACDAHRPLSFAHAVFGLRSCSWSVPARRAVSVVTVRHYAAHGWPLSGANSWLVAVAGVLFLVAFALKGAGWRRLLKRGERPGSHALAAANAAASVTGVALPGRLDDVVRIAVARRFSSRAGLGALCLSLVVVGSDRQRCAHAARVGRRRARRRLSRPACRPRRHRRCGRARGRARAGAAAPLEERARDELPPRPLARHPHDLAPGQHSRLGDRFSVVGRPGARVVRPARGARASGTRSRSPCSSSPRRRAQPSFPLGPAGAATQVGAGAAVLAAAGVPVSQAIAFGLAAQALIVLAGAAVVVLAGAWEARLRLVAARA